MRVGPHGVDAVQRPRRVGEVLLAHQHEGPTGPAADDRGGAHEPRAASTTVYSCARLRIGRDPTRRLLRPLGARAVEIAGAQPRARVIAGAAGTSPREVSQAPPITSRVPTIVVGPSASPRNVTPSRTATSGTK